MDCVSKSSPLQRLALRRLLRTEFRLSSTIRRLSLTPARPLLNQQGWHPGFAERVFRIFFIDERGNTLVATLVSIYLTHDVEQVSPFLFRGFGDGIVHFWLAAVEALRTVTV